MKATLKQLNTGFQALKRLAGHQLPKEQYKLTYKLGRILGSAQSEIDALQAQFDKLLTSFGIVRGEESSDLKALGEYNKAANDLLESNTVDLWGSPFRVEEILGVISITAEDFSLLDGWLILGELEEKVEEKAATAGA